MFELSGLGRILITLGAALVILGLVVSAAGRLPGLGRLPGDVLIKRPGFTLYVPITTMLLLSLILSLVAWIFRR